MLKLENEYYIRLILLLVKAGTDILRKTVIKCLEKRKIRLEDLLEKSKDELCRSAEISKLQRDYLYPPSPHYSDISKWDISMLSYIALNFLSSAFSGPEKVAVRKITEKRKLICQHSVDATIEEEVFLNEKNELLLMFKTLIKNMLAKDRQELTDLIEKFSSDELDLAKEIEELKHVEIRDDFFECIQTSLVHLQTPLDCADLSGVKEECPSISDILNQLNEITDSMEECGKSLELENKIIGTILICSDDQQEIDRAENLLLSASIEYIGKSEHTDTPKIVKKAVNTYLEEIEQLDVKLELVVRSPLTFTFVCSSLGALKDLIEYFEDTLIQTRLDGIAASLQSVTGQHATLSANIVMDPLRVIVENLAHLIDTSQQVHVQDMDKGIQQSKTDVVYTDHSNSMESQEKVFGLGKDFEAKMKDGKNKNLTGNAAERCTLFDTNIRSSGQNPNVSEKGTEEHTVALNNQSLGGAKNETKEDKGGYGANATMRTEDENKNKQSSPPPNRTTNTAGYDVDTGFNVNTTNTSNGTGSNDTPSTKPNVQPNNGTERWEPESEPSIMIHFHALISPEFKLDTKVDDVVVRIGDVNFGGWDNNNHKMQYVRTCKKGHIEMTYSFCVPTTRIVGRNKRLTYKYFVIRNTKNSKGNDRKNLWDHFYVRGSVGPTVNRRLSIPESSIKESSVPGSWHQYDCVVNRKPKKGVINWIKDKWAGSEKLQDDAELSAEVFGEELIGVLNGRNTSLDEIFETTEKIELLIRGIRRTYFNSAGCYNTENDLYSVLGKFLFQPLFACFKDVLNAPENTKIWWQTKMGLQFSVIAVLKSLNFCGIDLDTANVLCSALLITIESGTNECMEMNFILKHIPYRRNLLKNALVCLVQVIAKSSKDPSWMFVMPILHFVSGMCTPFDRNEDVTGHDKEVPTWWGMQNVKDAVDTFKSFETNSWTIPLEKILQILEPFFEMDYLLPRTIMSSLNLIEIYTAVCSNRIPVEVCCASLVYFLKTTRPKIWYGEVSMEENLVCKCIEIVAINLKQLESGPTERIGKVNWKLSADLSLVLANEALEMASNRNLTASNSITVHLLCASKYHDLQKSTAVANATRALCKKAIQWLEKQYSYFHSKLDDSLFVWNSFLTSDDVLLAHEIGSVWNRTITTALEQKLDSFIGNYKVNTETFVRYYCKNVEDINPSMQKCLHETAYKAMERCYKIDVGKFDSRERTRFSSLLSRLFEAEWTKMMKNVSSIHDEVFLLRLFQWSPFLHFMNIFFTKQQLDLLDDECKLNLMKTVSIIDTRVDQLMKGSIIVSDLKIAHKYQAIFAEVAVLVKHGEQDGFSVSKDMILKALNVRMMELEAFQSRANLMVTLTFLCKALPNVDVSPIENELQKSAFIEKCALSGFCQPVAVETIKDINVFVPRMTAFTLPDRVLTILPDIGGFIKSKVFLRMWESACEKNAESCKSLDDLLSIWEPISASWINQVKQIQEGTILFRDFEIIFEKACHSDYKMIEDELKTMMITNDVIQVRLDQFQKYSRHQICRAGAKVLLELKMKLGLSGNFSELQVIAEDGTVELEMAQFDDSFITAYRFLEEFSKNKVDCIHTFLNCQALVQWLKESMHTTGIKEFQVFVELAFIAIGDDPFNIGKVQALHSAVNGYAPLIFDLQPNCDFKGLLDLCNVVWGNLEVNSKLPKQLADTESQIEWLKEIKNAHGSVEVTSMMQTDAINSDGTIIIGKENTKKDIGSKLQISDILDIEDTIKVIVPGEKGIRKLREYTFTQLKDLQSRLMLVAGKAERGVESVERFTMILDGITRLSNVFIKLYSAGCVLFREWSVRFLCDPDPTKPVCAFMNFANENDKSQLKGRPSVNEDLKEMIPEIARFMESCLKDWLEHIDRKREVYPSLNYFTVDQLVILQREIIKFGDDEQRPSHLIYPILSAVKQDCTEDDVIEAMMQAKKRIGKTEDFCDSIKNDTSFEEGDKKEQRKQFIQLLVQAGQSETLAAMAFDNVDHDDVGEGILWCIEHAEDEIIEEADESEKAKDNSLNSWSHSSESMQTLIDRDVYAAGQYSDVGIEFLVKDLEKLWNHFLESIESNVKDYLSIEHLGVILEQLSSMEIDTGVRPFPLGFKEGVPNLIVCPSDDVLTTTLSIYLSGKGHSLPRADEILMCNADTTKEELGIFWRRAFADKGNKIHCLLNTELLPYNVAESTERQLEEHLQEVKHKYGETFRLCVICESDNKLRASTLASFLHKFKRQPPIVDINKLRAYVTSNVAVNKTEESVITPAAFVDHERLSVRVIKSWRPGVGKTLYRNLKVKALEELNSEDVNAELISIPLQEKKIDIHYVMERLLNRSLKPKELRARLFHVDISHEVQEGADYLLFNMLILGRLTDKTGYVWKKSNTDLHLIETMPLMIRVEDERGEKDKYVHQMLDILPAVTCRSPMECLSVFKNSKDGNISEQLFVEEEFTNELFQTPFQYLLRLEEDRKFEDIDPDNTEGDHETCLRILLRYCGVQNPSWAELHHFVRFLNTQLNDFRANVFLGAAAASFLPGFSKFTLKFLIQMSKDFSTRSLKISEESPGLMIDQLHYLDNDSEVQTEEKRDIVQLYEMRRTWESSPHPYIFFNADRMTLTFLGFNLEKRTGNLIDHQTGNILEKGIMKRNLFDALVSNNVPLQENFDILPRIEKIVRLRTIMGVSSKDDPDESYELTADNVKKMMAIYMRFRCNIPVIIMGETGCGKTRLVKFLCELQDPSGKVSNMVLMKVHGGTTSTDIIRSVQKAEALAMANQERHGMNMYTVLFLDEANSTEAVGLIKEVLCDRTIQGIPIKHCESLKIVAACNPYRKHSDELIKKLEQAGLGYHVDADETTDRLGRVPMRRLVYRVQPLPQSLLPLVWDFGQLNTQVEDLYIRQMVRRYINAGSLPNIRGLQEVTSAVLTLSQDYMRTQKDECSFVSLRDVERVLKVMSWFYQQSQGQRTLFGLMDIKLTNEQEPKREENDDFEHPERIDDITRSLVLALGVCYHACLKTRAKYRQYIAPSFKNPCLLPKGADQIFEEIDCCQNVFLDHVDLEKNIARNMALKENVFMMVICIELRIPLFLIGKPGSSKSLAKTIVSDAMRGNGAKTKLFREMKQAQMASFQCSPLSTPDGIVGTFKQCAQFQKDNDLNRFVSVVVLDEVGLAEDSPRMPLKTLHPLLEDGCQGDEDPQKYMKVAFIGISNWALDPAKMNRGIIVQRDVPDLEELINSARGICKTDSNLPNILMGPLIEPMAECYLDLFRIASKRMREFFGLRDFYSLVKMVFNRVEETRQMPTWFQMIHAITRNFGGLDEVNPVDHFKQRLSKIIPVDEHPREGDPDCSTAGLIRDCLFDINSSQSESRYLLLLTENFGALSIVQQLIQERSNDRPITIFGSSFRSDQEYTQVCRNINKIKVCMETGNTVVLLNLENLYESLYDALNQYYVTFGDIRYVDLGLGTHRVKCPVHPNFRLIVVAEKKTVYKKFPIPLINRLEKHFLTINTMLSVENKELVDKLKQWMINFASQRNSTMDKSEKSCIQIGDVFIGYHEDICPSVIVHLWQKNIPLAGDYDEEIAQQILEDAKLMLLWCSTPDAIARLDYSLLPEDEKQNLTKSYNEKQAHDSILEYLEFMQISKRTEPLLSQVTTHSKLLSTAHMDYLCYSFELSHSQMLFIETLSSFDTEQQFTNKIRQFIQSKEEHSKYIVIQCESGDINANLIACARYCVMSENEQMRKELKIPVHFLFIIQLPKVAGGCFTGFQCGLWHSAHIDDLLPEDIKLPAFRDMYGRSVGMLFGCALTTQDLQNEKLKEGGQAITVDQDDPDDCNTNGDDVSEDNAQDDIRLDDIVCDVNGIDPTEIQFDGKEKESKGSKLDVKSLVLACVPSALAIVKDKVEQKQRETDRVDIVLRFIHQDQDQQLFLKGLCFHIAKLLQEKEIDCGFSYKVKEWLVVEAAKFENINKAGTFRKSCIKVLESKVYPILAGVIAFCDTNENLNILGDDKFPWKQTLWIDVFNSLDALKFKELLVETNSKGLKEVSILSTSIDGLTFSARIPFSWLCIKKMTEVVNIDMPTVDEDDSDEFNDRMYQGITRKRVESLKRILGDHALFKLFNNIHEHDVIQIATAEYLRDVINTFYPTEDETDEFQIVFKAVISTIKDIQTEIHTDSFLDSVIHIHLVVDSLLPRLRLFHTLVTIWPECCEVLRTKISDIPETGSVLALRATHLMIEALSPRKKELDVKEDRAQWLNRCYRYRSIVEKVLAFYNHYDADIGDDTRLLLQKTKALWSRVMVMKLFIEHVCVSETDSRITITFCTPLWMLLGENTDMKNKDSIEAVEKFLKTCNKAAIKGFLGSLLKCSECEKVLEGYPITLPCNDILCDRCYADLKASGRDACVICQCKFEENWCPKQDSADRFDNKAEKKLKDYQKRCNTFFMDVVSQLSFADNSAPSKDVINKLLSYAFYKTRKERALTKTLSIFDTGIDPNPVFRSFLLQLLLKTSEKDVIENLEIYIKEAKEVLSVKGIENEEMLLNLSLLVTSCIEDKLMQNYRDGGSNNSPCPTKALETALKTIESAGLTVQKIYGLACARFGLKVVAESISKYILNNEGIPLAQVQKAKQLCQSTTTDWPRKYLVKYLCRFYGTDTYYAACKLYDMEWIQIAKSRIEECDRFVVCGSEYIKLRDAVMQTALTENTDILETAIKGFGEEDVQVEPLLQLAIYREITKTYLYPQSHRKICPKVWETLQNFLKECEQCRNQELMMRLMENRLVPSSLMTREDEDLKTQGVQSMIIHFLIMIAQGRDENNLLRPFKQLSLTPEKCVDFLLPTMPQDELEDIKEAIISSVGKVMDADKTPAYYKCPNGHPYMIGDCGQPVMKSKCQCGADIGGVNYVLTKNNTEELSKDRTLTGHILGRAENRGQGPKPERLLTPAQCATIRLFVHIAMYLGAGCDREGMKRLIHPDIESALVEEFLWHHIQSDIDDIHRAIGRSVDDVLLLIHCIVNDMIVKSNEGKNLHEDVYLLSTKTGRQIWEDAFTSAYLKDTLLEIDSLLQQHNSTMLNDKRSGADPLLNLLYETEITPKSKLLLQEVPMVWSYRTPVTLHHLRQRFDAEFGHDMILLKNYSILQLFLKEEYHLRALRFVPSILRLQSALLQRYQRKINKAEASMITVAKLKREQVLGHDTKQLIDGFAKAWTLCRESLTFYVCKTGKGSTTISPENSNHIINDDTPVSMLLPTTDGDGLCSYILLDFLMRKQNDFLDKYFQETGHASSNVKVSPKEITSADLISYDEEHDLIPLVLANCQYTFMMGEGTKIDYDFKGLERQIMDRFLFSKSKIDVDSTLQVDMMIYQTESTNTLIFKKLSTYIPQEKLSSSLKTNICHEMKGLPDICQSLYNIDIAISFLKTTGGLPEQNLHEYMMKTLQMKSSVSSQKAQQMCQFRHIQSLWLLLALLKSKTMTDSHQRREFTFESVQSVFDAELSQDEQTVSTQYCKDLSVEKLNCLVECLHDFILLKVAVKQNVDDEDYIDITQNKLKDWLLAYVFEREDKSLDPVILEDFPEDVRLKHSVHMWVIAYNILKKKHTMCHV